MFAEFSIESQSWSEFFFFAAVVVAVVALVLCMLKVPLESFFLWALMFVVLGCGFAGLLFQ